MGSVAVVYWWVRRAFSLLLFKRTVSALWRFSLVVSRIVRNVHGRLPTMELRFVVLSRHASVTVNGREREWRRTHQAFSTQRESV